MTFEIDPKKSVMADMFKLSEDERIDMIVQTALRDGHVVFMVDSDAIEKGKADRYVQKIQAKYPGIVEVCRCENYPVAGVVSVQMRLGGVRHMNRAPILDQLEDQWERIVAAMVWKLGKGNVVLTAQDLRDFPTDRIFLTYGHHDSIEFKLVTREEADRIVEHQKTQQGQA